MYALHARYVGPTDHRGSRIIVRSGHTRTIHPYTYDDTDPWITAMRAHVARVPALADLMARGYRLAFGTMPPGRDGHDVSEWVAVIVADR